MGFNLIGSGPEYLGIGCAGQTDLLQEWIDRRSAAFLSEMAMLQQRSDIPEQN